MKKLKSIMVASALALMLGINIYADCQGDCFNDLQICQSTPFICQQNYTHCMNQCTGTPPGPKPPETDTDSFASGGVIWQDSVGWFDCLLKGFGL